MPQLYTNQVKLQSASAPTGTAPQIQNFVGQALQNVGNFADQVAQDIARTEDSRLKVEVDAKTRQAMTMLEEADPKNFDYEQVKQKAMDIYNSAFDGFNGAAVRRYNKYNPEHSDVFELAVEKVSLEKSREKTYYNMDESLPQWASNVALGKMSEKEYHAAIDHTNLTQNQKKTLKDKLNNSANEFKIAAALSYGTQDKLVEAQRLVEDLGIYMTPERRAFWAAQINSKVASIKKDRDTAAKEKNGMLQDLLYETYLSSYYRDPAKAAEFKKDLEEIYVSGKPITFANGMSISGDINSADYISPIVISEVMTKIKNTAATDSSLIQDTADRLTANQVIEDNAMFAKANTKGGLSENARKAEAVVHSRVFSELDKTTQEKVMAIANSRVLATQYSVGAARLDLEKQDVEIRKKAILPFLMSPVTSSVPSAPKQILTGIRSGNVEKFTEGVAFARRELNEKVFSGDLEQKADSNSFHLTTAYITLDAMRKDPAIMKEFGGVPVTSESLTKAFWGMLDEMTDKGTYNQPYNPEGEYSINGPYGRGFLKTLLERASGVSLSTEDTNKREFQRNLESYVLAAEQPWGTAYIPSTTSTEDVWTFRRGADTKFGK